MHKALVKFITFFLPTKRCRRDFRNRYSPKIIPVFPNSQKLRILKCGIKKQHLKKRNAKVNKNIDIIVPVYNGFRYLEPLFNSIIKNTDIAYHLIVIDDCSTDKNVLNFLNRIQKQVKGKMTLICNEQNLGFLQSANIGLSISKNDCVLLNTDVELPAQWASRLFSAIFEFEQIASVTPFSNAATIFSFPEIGVDNLLNGSAELNKIDNIFSKMDTADLPILAFPTGVGFCMAMSRNALDTIGLFDPIFGKGYCEENDWCQRANKAGFINTIAPNLFVYHKHGGSFPSDEKASLCLNNMTILNERYPSYIEEVQVSIQNMHYQSLRKECLRNYRKLK